MSDLPIRIGFDLSDVVDEFSLTSDQVTQMGNAVTKALTMEVYRNWIEAAKINLHSTRNQYIRGLVIAEEGKFTNTITLTGKLNNMVEEGVPAFDMKTGLLKSEKVRYTTAGKRYITIPFRFATPEALGESEAFDNVLPQEIYDIVKDFKPKVTSNDSSNVGYDVLKEQDIPEEYRVPKTRKSVLNEVMNRTFDEYTHKSSIFAGIQKDAMTYENAQQSSYVSFRRVSENSDPMSWIHTGIIQYNLSQQAMDNTDTDVIVENTVDKILSEFGL